MRRAKEIPGPGEYGVGTFYKPDTPAFSMCKYSPPTDVDIIRKRASESPGPGEYHSGVREKIK